MRFNKIYPIFPYHNYNKNIDNKNIDNDYFYNIWCGVIYGLCFCLFICILLAVFLVIFIKNTEINDFSWSA